jgi:hypothetical protein
MADASQLGAPSDDHDPRCLTVLYSGDAKLRNRIIPIGNKLCIGRSVSDGIDLAIEDRLLSRKHASLSRIGSSNVYEMVDHDSRNGSFVDGVRMQRCHLTDGSILRLGVSVFELTTDAPDAPSVEQPVADDRDALVGRSVAFRHAVTELSAAARSTSPGIISGEAGTGKTMAAACSWWWAAADRVPSSPRSISSAASIRRPTTIRSQTAICGAARAGRSCSTRWTCSIPSCRSACSRS